MKTGNLFMKTLPFAGAKLLLGLAFLLVCAILGAIMIGIGRIFGEVGAVVGFCIWCGVVGVIRFAMMHYAGYLLKAGHVAVIAEAATTGEMPANQIKYGIGKVKARFATSNVYFAVDKLVTAAVKEIQRVIGKVADILDFLPGMEAVASLAQFFVSISLGYIDECCLGWTFIHPEDGAFKSAADGVVIYAQNWKPLLKGSAKTMLKTLLLCLAVLLLIFIPTGLLFRLFDWSLLIAFLIACFLTWVAKFALLDSYIMISMMNEYMQAAAQTTITFDLYGKLCGASAKFRELFSKGKEEQPAAFEAAPAGAYGTPAPAPAPEAAPSRFCPACGASNENGSKFCPSCGTKL